MNFIIWIAIGGVLGWAASVFIRTNSQQGIILNVAVGIIGAVLGGWLLGGLFESSTINQGNFSATGLLVSLLGSIILLALVKLFGGSTRST